MFENDPALTCEFISKSFAYGNVIVKRSNSSFIIFLLIFKDTDHGGHKTLIKALVLKVLQEA